MISIIAEDDGHWPLTTEGRSQMPRAHTAKPLITVVGASSKQGRSVAHALLDSGRYRVRALTRRRHADPARARRERGPEVVGGPWERARRSGRPGPWGGSSARF